MITRWLGAVVLLAGCAPLACPQPPATVSLPLDATATIRTTAPGETPQVSVTPSPPTTAGSTPVAPPAPSPTDNTMLQTYTVGGTVSTSHKMSLAECETEKAAAQKHTDLVDPETGKLHPSNVLSAECNQVPPTPLKPAPKKRPTPPLSAVP
jgi:hypothetical protein